MSRASVCPAALALAVVTACLCAGVPAQEIKKGPWQPRHCPEGWVLHETRNYQVQSQAGLEKGKRLGEHMEAMLKTYKAMFKPDKSVFKQYTIKLFKDRASFIAYGASPGAGAYYSATDREMVCYDTGKWMDEQEAEGPVTGEGGRRPDYRELYAMDILGAAAHEGWHQYFHWYVTSWVQLPSWINEGMGDYFYTAVPKQEKGRKIPAELGRLNLMRLLVVQSAAKQDRLVPLADLLRYTQREYYANASVCYAQGWALCHFLLHGGNKDHAQVIPTFVRLVQNDTNMETVTNRAFKGIDLAQLEKEFVEWVKAQQLPGRER